MLDKTIKIPNQNQHVLKKTSSRKSCQALLCFTDGCNQDETKEKQKTLNNQYFQKLSLKKFNHSSFLNQSHYERQRYEQYCLKRERSTQQNGFRNIVLTNNFQQTTKYSIGGNFPKSPNYSIKFEEQMRIARSSSHKQLDRPQLKTTDRSIQKQLQIEVKRIQDLQQLRTGLQTQIRELDQNIDKYYTIYNTKMEQLRRIQSKMKEFDKDRTLQKVPSTDDLKYFKKKPSVDSSPTLNMIDGQKRYEYKSGMNNSNSYGNLQYKTMDMPYFPAKNIQYIKKTN